MMLAQFGRGTVVVLLIVAVLVLSGWGLGKARVKRVRAATKDAVHADASPFW